MSTLVIYRGLPGSGKSTEAVAWVAANRAQRARVNLDDLRDMIDDGTFVADVTEPRVVTAHTAAITALLATGRDVVCDDTNLTEHRIQKLLRIARDAGADTEIRDLTNVPVEVCIARDATRLGRDRVGEDVIRRMHDQIAGQPWPLPVPKLEDAADDPIPYSPRPYAWPAVLVDVDGTVALRGDRSPYDETLVHLDQPNQPVITVVRSLHAAGHLILFLSGRSEACRADTEHWLAQHVAVPYPALLMRPTGDQRQDAIVKAELFDTHIRDRYRVVCVLDDRNQVVAMWRRMGLTVLQVADGNF